MTEAAEALACADGGQRWVALAKRDRSLLWERGPRGAYQALFGTKPGAYRVWRCVLVLRAVRSQVAERVAQREGRAAATGREAGLLTAHLVFRLLDLSRIDDPDFDWDAELARVPELVDAVFDRLIHYVDAEFGIGSYPATVFRKPDRCAILVKRVLNDVRTGVPLPELPPDYLPLAAEVVGRKSNAVPVLVDARRIPDGTALEFRAMTGPERLVLTPWLAADPRRGQATWTNRRGFPLVWAADGKRYSPSGLVKHMLRQAGRPTRAVQGTSRWFVPGEGSLATIANEVRQEDVP